MTHLARVFTRAAKICQASFYAGARVRIDGTPMLPLPSRVRVGSIAKALPTKSKYLTLCQTTFSQHPHRDSSVFGEFSGPPQCNPVSAAPHSGPQQAPAGWKSWAEPAVGENVVVEIPYRCPPTSGIVKQIIRVPVTVKVCNCH